MSDYLDYLAGLVAGDGNIVVDKYGRSRVRVFDASREFLESVCSAIKAILGYNCRVHWDGTTWYLSVYSKELVEELEPRLVNPVDIKEWLKGFVDAEGSIYEWVRKKSKVYYQVSITNTNIKHIENAEKALRDLEVEYRINVIKDKWKPRYKILVNKVKSLKRFLLEVGFRHPLKAEKARHVLHLLLLLTM